MGNRSAKGSFERLMSLVFGTATTVNRNTNYLPLWDGANGKRVSVARLLATPAPDPIATDGTVDLSSYAASDVTLTGTDTVSAFVVPEGSTVRARVTDGFIATYDATDLPIPGKADVLLMPGDLIELKGGAGDVGEIVSIVPAGVQVIERTKYITDSTGSVTPDADGGYDILDVDCTHAVMTTFNTPTGTPRDKQELILDLHHTGTPKNLDLTAYLELGAHAPVILNGPGHTAGGICRVSLKYDLPNTTWQIVDVRQEGIYPWGGDIADYVTANAQPLTRPIVPKVADYTVLNTESGTIFTNTGTAADVTFTLPASAGCTAGKTRFSFYLTEVGQRLKVEVDGSDHLYFVYGGTPFDITGGANTTANATGSMIDVIFHSGAWYVNAVAGDWA